MAREKLRNYKQMRHGSIFYGEIIITYVFMVFVFLFMTRYMFIPARFDPIIS